jgi:hypothetical protein
MVNHLLTWVVCCAHAPSALPRSAIISAMLAVSTERDSAMADDLKKRGPADATRINVNETWEVEHWCKEFRCTESELKEAVDTVGVLAKDVRIFIATHKPTATD